MVSLVVSNSCNPADVWRWLRTAAALALEPKAGLKQHVVAAQCGARSPQFEVNFPLKCRPAADTIYQCFAAFHLVAVTFCCCQAA